MKKIEIIIIRDKYSPPYVWVRYRGKAYVVEIGEPTQVINGVYNLLKESNTNRVYQTKGGHIKYRLEPQFNIYRKI